MLVSYKDKIRCLARDHYHCPEKHNGGFHAVSDTKIVVAVLVLRDPHAAQWGTWYSVVDFHSTYTHGISNYFTYYSHGQDYRFIAGHGHIFVVDDRQETTGGMKETSPITLEKDVETTPPVISHGEEQQGNVKTYSIYYFPVLTPPRTSN